MSKKPNIAHAIYKEHLPRFQHQFPHLFNKDAPVPLMVGIRDRLVKRGFNPVTVDCVLRCWTSRIEYRRRLTMGGARYNLKGVRSGSVTIKQREYAKELVEKFEQSKLNRGF
ncbi:RNA chaperone [Aeromonas phage BUCT695]|uniref:RNA chaperone n=1 Tax=Aeromonas phage BUCT695 TaxID=2908630 RepID=UPI00232994E3|nr:RNA chaperone [Aeromonas phage BUCT695]UIW10504.1 RNA chaperone [Aeromonas phage BUCT695]